MTGETLLELTAVGAGYGLGAVLFDVSFRIDEGEVVTLLGRNGMGKTTIVRTVMGLLGARHGSIRFRGRDITRQRPHRIARLGIGYVPEGRQIFAGLTVRENLLAAARPGRWTLERVLALFPHLGERLDWGGGTLSGGEQQMLAIGRALMTDPTLLILDEATEGLAPVVRREIWRVIAELKLAGHAILLIDKNLRALMRLADRHCVIEKGRVVWTGDTPALQVGFEAIRRYVGV